MRLNMSWRKGHFNLLNPSEESISFHMDVDREQYINLQFDTDESAVDWIDNPHSWVDTACQLIDKWAKRRWSTTKDEVMKFKTFITEHQKELDEERLKEVIEQKRTKMLKLSEEIGELEKDLLELLKNSLTGEILLAVQPRGE